MAGCGSWVPYQRTNFVTPAFPGYPSGHSTFSRSAAEVLTAMTGSEFFPGGISWYTITNLVNELGPTQPVTLQWATYFDAADQVGVSRIWGGIHPPVDDFAGAHGRGVRAGRVGFGSVVFRRIDYQPAVEEDGHDCHVDATLLRIASSDVPGLLLQSAIHTEI